jgi:hypothetical protein
MQFSFTSWFVVPVDFRTLVQTDDIGNYAAANHSNPGFVDKKLLKVLPGDVITVTLGAGALSWGGGNGATLLAAVNGASVLAPSAYFSDGLSETFHGWKVTSGPSIVPVVGLFDNDSVGPVRNARGERSPVVTIVETPQQFGSYVHSYTGDYADLGNVEFLDLGIPPDPGTVLDLRLYPNVDNNRLQLSYHNPITGDVVPLNEIVPSGGTTYIAKVTITVDNPDRLTAPTPPKTFTAHDKEKFAEDAEVLERLAKALKTAAVASDPVHPIAKLLIHVFSEAASALDPVTGVLNSTVQSVLELVEGALEEAPANPIGMTLALAANIVSAAIRLLKALHDDPPDGNYSEIYQAPAWNFGDIPGASVAQNALVMGSWKVVQALANALAAVERYQGAELAGDAASQSLQEAATEAAIADFQQQRSQLALDVKTLLAELPDSLWAANLAGDTSLADAQAYLAGLSDPLAEDPILQGLIDHFTGLAGTDAAMAALQEAVATIGAEAAPAQVGSALLAAARTATRLVPNTRWNEAADGDWAIAGHWTPAKVPDGAQDAIIKPAGSYTVTVSSDQSVNTLVIDSPSVAVVVSNGATLDIEGINIRNAGVLALESTGDATMLRIHSRALVGGGGSILLSGDARITSGDGAAAELINRSNTISGAGTIGDSAMTLTNRGMIEALGGVLELDTGAGVIINRGTLKAGAGGTLLVASAVRGYGSAIVDGGILEFADRQTSSVTYSAAGGILRLDDSGRFAGTVVGLGGAGNAIDLTNVAFASAAASFQEDPGGTKGMLTIGDGAHAASIRLLGDYAANFTSVPSPGYMGFVLSDDGTASHGTAVSYLHV